MDQFGIAKIYNNITGEITKPIYYNTIVLY